MAAPKLLAIINKMKQLPLPTAPPPYPITESLLFLDISTIAGYQMAITSTLRAISGAEVGRNHALKSLLRNVEIEQGQHQTSFSRVESYLSFVSIDKTTFRTARPSIRSAANMEDSFSRTACFQQTSGLNPCF